MNFIFVLLLTALLSNNVFAVPTSRLSGFRRNENDTVLELIAQYKQYKLQADQAKELRTKLLKQAKSKKLAIESKIGFSSSPRTAKSTSSGSVEPFTVLTATGSAIVFASHGTTSTVLLNLTTTSPPATSTSITSPSIGLYTVLTATSSVVVVASQGSTRTVTLNLTATTSPVPTSPPATEPMTVLTATGSLIVLASQGTTKTVTLNATTTTPMTITVTSTSTTSGAVTSSKT